MLHWGAHFEVIADRIGLLGFVSSSPESSLLVLEAICGKICSPCYLSTNAYYHHLPCRAFRASSSRFGKCHASLHLFAVHSFLSYQPSGPILRWKPRSSRPELKRLPSRHSQDLLQINKYWDGRRPFLLPGHHLGCWGSSI
jgi:hypothetical protein